MRSISINFSVPNGWHELSDKQLRYVFSLIAGDCSCKREQRSSSLEPMPSEAELGCNQFSTEEIQTICLLRWSGAKVVGRQQSGSYLLRIGKERVSSKEEREQSSSLLTRSSYLFEVTPLTLAELLPHLAWLAELPSQPVRLSKMNRHEGVTADFGAVPFETYIVADNLYQGYLQTQNEGLLDELATVLYPGIKAKALNAENRVAIFYWMASLKTYFSHRYSDFLQPVSTPDRVQNLLGQPSQSVEEAMNAQIRALTKGDPTKEAEVLALDTHRALTELNAQAREYKQLQAQIKQP